MKEWLLIPALMLTFTLFLVIVFDYGQTRGRGDFEWDATKMCEENQLIILSDKLYICINSDNFGR